MNKEAKKISIFERILCLSLLTFTFLPAVNAEEIPPGQLTWIINSHAYDLLQHVNESSASLSKLYFSNNKTYFTVLPTIDPTTIPLGSHPTLTYKSYQKLKEDFIANKIPSFVEAIMYDNEHWDDTPKWEQRDPVKYYRLVAELVHSHHLKFVAAPAINITNQIEQGYAGDRYAEFIRLKLAAEIARYADVYEIQAQRIQQDRKAFVDFVRKASAQAIRANPAVIVLVGICTNPGGQTVQATHLNDLIRATRKITDGYWLNIPGTGSCPDCGEPKPEVAAYLLKMLSGAPTAGHGH